MILSGHEISRCVKAGTIVIDPFTPDQVNPNSYNYRLGPWIRMTCPDRNQDSKRVVTIRIPEEGLLLMPKRVYLGHTAEAIGSSSYVTSLIGRSSVGRLGLYLQISADLGNLGAAHAWTLEICVVQPLRIYSGMKIGQVSFWRPIGVSECYSGVYTDYSLPAGCLDHSLGRMQA